MEQVADVCEQGFYKARVDSVVRVRRPVESDPRLRGFRPDVRWPGVENRWDSEKSQTALLAGPYLWGPHARLNIFR